MLNIILCGAPGSGKGTQSDFIVAKYGLTHLSTGDLMRKEMASGSELGQLLNSYISQGHLVPDDVTVQLLEQYIDSLPKDTKGLIFDGFPSIGCPQFIEPRRRHFGRDGVHRGNVIALVRFKVLT